MPCCPVAKLYFLYGLRWSCIGWCANYTWGLRGTKNPAPPTRTSSGTGACLWQKALSESSAVSRLKYCNIWPMNLIYHILIPNPRQKFNPLQFLWCFQVSHFSSLLAMSWQKQLDHRCVPDVSGLAWPCVPTTPSSWRTSWACAAACWASSMFAPLPSGARPAGCQPWETNTHPNLRTTTRRWEEKADGRWLVFLRAQVLAVAASEIYCDRNLFPSSLVSFVLTCTRELLQNVLRVRCHLLWFNNISPRSRGTRRQKNHFLDCVPGQLSLTRFHSDQHCYVTPQAFFWLANANHMVFTRAHTQSSAVHNDWFHLAAKREQSSDVCGEWIHHLRKW